MKLRNLFFASVAVAGLFSACSNEMDEVANNSTTNETTGETAYMQVGFGSPASAATRATETEVGDKTEQNFKDVALIILNNANQVSDAILLTASQFAPEGNTGGASGAENVKYYISKAAIAVNKLESAKVYAFVNPKGYISKVVSDIAANKDVTFSFTEAFTLTEATDIAEYASDQNFFMANEAGLATIANVTGTKEAPTAVKVRVERIAAKLQETTPNTTPSRTFTAKKAGLNLEDSKLKITLAEYAYTNLNKTSYIIRQDDATYQGIDFNFGYTTKPYDPATAFFFPNVETNTEYAGYGFKEWNAASENDPNKVLLNATYCFENTETAVDQYTNRTVGILYKAVANWDGQPTGSTFYTYLNTVYFTWDELKTVYNKIVSTSNRLLEESDYTIAQLTEKGIKKYENGVCYYRVMIKHNTDAGFMGAMKFAVVRNNVYKMAVKTINGLGEPSIPVTPDPDETDKAQIVMTIDVAPWTVRSNENIEL